MPDRYGDTDTTPPAPEPATNADTRHRRAQAITAAIQACHLCDDDGYLAGTVCHHHDYRPAARRGMAEIRRVMGWTPKTENADLSNERTTPA